jgi:hypothetical protein
LKPASMASKKPWARFAAACFRAAAWWRCILVMTSSA